MKRTVEQLIKELQELVDNGTIEPTAEFCVPDELGILQTSFIIRNMSSRAIYVVGVNSK